MPSQGKAKYDYGKNGGKDLYGVEAPDFRETDDWGDLLKAVTGVTLLFVGEIGTRQIKEQMCGWMPQGRDRQRYENRIATAIETLEAGRILESYGVLWTRYRRAAPVEKKEVVIDSKKLDEWKRYEREQYSSHPTYQFQ